MKPSGIEHTHSILATPMGWGTRTRRNQAADFTTGPLAVFPTALPSSATHPPALLSRLPSLCRLSCRSLDRPLSFLLFSFLHTHTPLNQ